MAGSGSISASLEDYLEAIYHICSAKQAARAKDIVQRLGVHNSSVTQALRSLGDKGLINYAPYDIVTLTPEGRALAENVLRRHRTLHSFLTGVLAIDPGTAEESACRMEHAIDGVILERLVQFLEFLDDCPLTSVEYSEERGFHCGRCAPDLIPEECDSEVCGLRRAPRAAADRQAGGEGQDEGVAPV
jgi:DtxR family Mn-dependent transcriptional regulator